jgi:hypothetical protein
MKIVTIVKRLIIKIKLKLRKKNIQIRNSRMKGEKVKI